MNTERLASFVVETPGSRIPAPAIDEARRAVVDTLGCALAGVDEPVARVANQWIRECGSKPAFVMWGTANACSLPDAAFANAIASHALDFDDSLSSLRGHPSAILVPTALAIGQATRSSGREVLEAYVIGLEVAGKLGKALGDSHYFRGWHTTATAGVFGSAAVAGRLLRLKVEQMRIAFGLAASQAAGLVRNFGTMTKSLHAGNAARNGVVSACLAAQGFTADPAILDGSNDFLTTYASEHRTALDAILDRLGAPWEILDPGLLFKRWPCCFASHRSIGGMLGLLRDHAIVADEVQSIEIGFLPGSDSALVSQDPRTGLEAKFSIEYVAAATLVDREITLDSFTDENVMRPRVRELMAKVHRRRIENEGTYSGLVGYTDVAITTSRGRYATRVDRTPGSLAWPMSVEEMDAKFRTNARRVLSRDATDRVAGLLAAFETLADVAAIAAATRLTADGAMDAHTVAAH